MPSLFVTCSNSLYELPFYPGVTVREILEPTFMRVRSSCGGLGRCGLCAIRVSEGRLHEFTAAERHKLTPGQKEQGVRLACQLRPVSDLRIVVEESLASVNWGRLSPEDFPPACDRLKPPVWLPQHGTALGAAIDLGTTRIRVSLWNLRSGVRLAGRSGLNPQAIFGADVLTRIVQAAVSETSALEMRRLVSNSIGEALADIAAREGIDLDDVCKLVVVGNTPMLSLLTGRNYESLITPDNWIREVDCVPEDVAFLPRAWGCRNDTVTEIVRPLAGFVGSDLLAGVIAVQLPAGPAGSLLIDFGTNSEIALWDGDTLWITSAAGGPAFEGSGISYGLPAEPGAIYRAEPLAGGKQLAVAVLGGTAARGICGSGLVDIMAALLKMGHLRDNGRFNLELDQQGYPVVPEGEGVFLKKGDVDLFQRAKAGIAAAVQCLLQRASMKIDHLERVCVSGAFGSYLNVGNGQALGLLPAIPPERVELCGNTALSGCELLLFSSDSAILLKELKKRAKLVNLANDMEFEHEFIQSLFLRPMQVDRRPD